MTATGSRFICCRTAPTRRLSSGYVDHPEDRIWRIGGLSNAELARRVREAGLDVLVDLNGYSRQARLRLVPPPPGAATDRVVQQLCHQRAVPASICWWAMPRSCTPQEERHYCERIVRVPGSYLAFEVRYPVPEVAPPPVLRNGWLPSVPSHRPIRSPTRWWRRGRASCWAHPPRGCCCATGRLNDPSNRLALMARFARHGVAPDRLMLSGGAEHFDFLRGYDEVDIASRHVPVQWRHDHHRGAVAGRAGADLQRRPLGQPHQSVAAAGGGSVGVGCDGRGGLRQPRRRAGTVGDTPLAMLAALRARDA